VRLARSERGDWGGSKPPQVEVRFEAAERLGETGASVAQILGRTILLYRKHPKKPRFEKP